MIPANSFGI